MALAEKIAIGFLEEDNPVKSYYRFKPMLVETEDGYVPLENVGELYPDEGYLRIVPDKNESSYFKGRMRRIGRYCMIDLRKHLSESDKIRPNKNYRSDGIERNVNIVYSDVIIEIPAGKAAEVIPCADPAELREVGVCPGSTPFMLECDGKFVGPYQWVLVEGSDDMYRPERHEAFLPADGDSLPEGLCFELKKSEDSLPCTLLLAAPGKTLFVAAEKPAEEEKTAEPPKPEPEKTPAPEAEAKPAPAEKPAPEVKPAEEPVLIVEAAEDMLELEETPKAAEPPKPAAEEKPAPAKPAEIPKPREEKSKISQEKPKTEYVEPRAAQMKPAVSAGRMSQRSAMQAAQRGLNPKRGVSLAEIVDDLWRTSRLDQLGHPIPAEAGSRPMLSPVDRAREALKIAWALDEARGGVLDAVLSLEHAAELLPERLGQGSRPLKQSEIQELDEFEARRLKALRELDELSRARASKRTELLEEVRREFAIELRKLQKQNDLAKAEAEKSRQLADAAAETARVAQKALSNITGEQLLEQLLTDELRARAAAMLKQLDRQEAPAAPLPKLTEPTLGELVSDLRVAFEDYGMSLSNDQAVNLLAGVALQDVCIYSGVTGSGKSRAARLLAQTLGLTDGRFVTLHANPKPAAADKKFSEMNAVADAFTPMIALIDDANNAPGDPSRGLASMHEDAADGIHPNMKLIMTVQDNPVGYALNANLLDRAFFVRFDLPGLDLPWKPVAVAPRKREGAVSMDALRRLFVPGSEISPEVQDRMMTLRRKLADLGVYFSARALSDMHRYITTVQPMMTCAPMQVLDYALAQRAIPHVLATAPVAALHELPKLLADMPMCLRLMEQPLALPEL